MIARIWAIVFKEFIQIRRDPRTLAIVLVMPLMQLIPFRRDDWESVVLPVDVEKDAAAVAEMKANRHAYKDSHWKRPEYT